MKPLNCLIETLKKKDISTCVDIFDATLGEDYITGDKLLSMLNNGKFICLKALVHNRLVGVNISCIMNFSEAIDYLKLAKHKIPTAMKKNAQVAVLKTGAIKQEYQRKGIGGLFVKSSEKAFSEKGVHLVLSVVWRHDGVENAGALLQKNGYKSLCIIKDYWLKDSLQEGFSCPVCGNQGCHCSANIYFKEI